jgi:hypothetical protein
MMRFGIPLFAKQMSAGVVFVTKGKFLDASAQDVALHVPRNDVHNVTGIEIVKNVA